MIVTLTDSQLALARRIGRERNQRNRRKSVGDNVVTGHAMSSSRVDEDGAAAELAVALGLERSWTGVTASELRGCDSTAKEWRDFKADGTDVEGLEVRSTRHRNGCLILHDTDAADVPFVLAIQVGSRAFHLAGYILPSDGRQRRWWKDVGYGRPAYYVPQRELCDIDELVVTPLRVAPRRCELCGDVVVVLVDVSIAGVWQWVCSVCRRRYDGS
jgi:hypothetical protein